MILLRTEKHLLSAEHGNLILLLQYFKRKTNKYDKLSYIVKYICYECRKKPKCVI